MGQEYVSNDVRMGDFHLNSSQVGRLSNYNNYSIGEHADGMVGTITDIGNYGNAGYNDPSFDGTYIGANRQSNDEGDQLGDCRVYWQIVVCAEYTVLAQQMNTGEYNTFRLWNPEKEDREWGEDVT